MTDPTHSPDDLDEVLSSLLDGEADDATRARIESDPAAMARLEELRAARDLVADPVPPLDEVTARRLRQTAISAVDPATRTEEPHRRAVTGKWIASAAAVLLLLVVAVPVLGQLTDQDDDGDQTASVALDSGDESDESSAAAPEASDGADASSDDASGGGTPEVVAAGSVPFDLGAHGTNEALGDAALSAQEGATPVERSSSNADSSAGEDFDEAGESSSVPELVLNLTEALGDTSTSCGIQTPLGAIATFVGTVQGQERLAWAIRDEDGGLSVIVIDPETCTIVAARP